MSHNRLVDARLPVVGVGGMDARLPSILGTGILVEESTMLSVFIFACPVEITAVFGLESQQQRSAHLTKKMILVCRTRTHLGVCLKYMELREKL